MVDEDQALKELEAEKLKAEQEKLISEQAEKVAAKKVDELKSSLIDSIAGKKVEAAPKSWSELHENIKSDTLSEVEKREASLRKEIDELKSDRQKEKDEQKQSEESIRVEKQRIDVEWKELVEDGELPKIKPEVLAKIEKNEALTDEDKQDEGLQAYNELIKTHFENNRGGSLYRTFKKHFNQQPAGAHAPVLGGRMRPTQNESDDDYTYDEVAKQGRALGLRQ